MFRALYKFLLFLKLQKFVLTLSVWSPDGLTHVINSTVLEEGKKADFNFFISSKLRVQVTDLSSHCCILLLVLKCINRSKVVLYFWVLFFSSFSFGFLRQVIGNPC